jgi:hypothetical protein
VNLGLVDDHGDIDGQTLVELPGGTLGSVEEEWRGGICSQGGVNGGDLEVFVAGGGELKAAIVDDQLAESSGELGAEGDGCGQGTGCDTGGMERISEQYGGCSKDGVRDRVEFEPGAITIGDGIVVEEYAELGQPTGWEGSGRGVSGGHFGTWV